MPSQLNAVSGNPSPRLSSSDFYIYWTTFLADKRSEHTCHTSLWRPDARITAADLPQHVSLPDLL